MFLTFLIFGLSGRYNSVLEVFCMAQYSVWKKGIYVYEIGGGHVLRYILITPNTVQLEP